MAGRVVGNRRPQWSELQGDLLELILEKLDLADHARFASVCSSWRSVAVENPPINKPLYFALSHEPDILVRRFISSFLPYWETALFIGAGLDGWVVILIDGRDLFLLNKGFNSIIQLPPLPNDSKLCKAVVLSSSSSGECTVVIKHSYEGVYYCRPGSDKSFIELSIVAHWVEDILFYKGQLYVLWSDYNLNTSNITIFDHLLNKVTQLVAHFGHGTLHRYGHSRWLISENKLLITVGDLYPVVFEFEPSESRLVRVENINDNLLLLLNRFFSLSITANEHKEFRWANSFYSAGYYSTFVLDTSKDISAHSNKEKVDDPLPLFFVMFHSQGVKNAPSMARVAMSYCTSI